MPRPPSTLASRRVLADALTAAEDPRGEFIALQCWLSESVHVEPAAWSTVRLRSEQLLARHKEAWVAPLTAAYRTHTAPYLSPRVQFRRGFIERVELTAASAALGEWLAEHSAVNEVRASQEGLTQLAQTELWGNLRAVECSGSRLDDLLTGKNTAHLEVLNLNECGAVRNLNALVVLPLPAVREVGLRGLGLSKRSVSRLRDAPWLPQLHSLDLGATRLDMHGLGSLVEQATDLRVLRAQSLKCLSANSVDWSDGRAWEGLNLRSTWGGVNLPALGTLNTSALHTLDLSSPVFAVATSDYEALAAAWSLPSMRDLTLSNTRMGDAALKVLAEAGWFGRVRSLVLRSNSIEAKGLEALLAADPPCSTLDLSSNKLDDHAMRALAAWPGLARVAALDLSQNRRVTADALYTLLCSPHLQAVRIDVEGLGTDARCVDRLKQLTAGVGDP